MALTQRLWWFSGWPGAVMLGGVYLAVEMLAVAIGGNRGSMMFVAWHFVVAPLVAAVGLVMTLIAATRPASAIRRLLTVSSIAVNILIIWIALRADLGILRYFSFN